MGGSSSAGSRPAPSGSVDLLITAAELRIRAALGVEDAAETNLEPKLGGVKEKLTADLCAEVRLHHLRAPSPR